MPAGEVPSYCNQGQSRHSHGEQAAADDGCLGGDRSLMSQRLTLLEQARLGPLHDFDGVAQLIIELPPPTRIRMLGRRGALRLPQLNTGIEVSQPLSRELSDPGEPPLLHGIVSSQLSKL